MAGPAVLARPGARQRRLTYGPPWAGSPAFAFIGGTFYVAGGGIALLVAWLQSQTRHPGQLAGLGLLSLLAGAVVARSGDRMPQPLRRFLNFGGTATILAMIVAAGPNPAGEALYWLFGFVPVGAFVFFAWRWALAMITWAAVTTGVVSFGVGVMAPVEWIVSSVVGVTVAFTVNGLVRFAAASEWDPTTGMLNRRGVRRVVGAACVAAAQHHHPFALALVRVGFGGVPGDRRGLADAAGRAATAWLAHEPPQAATWGRLSDDEFVIVWDGAEGLEQYLEAVVAQAAGVVAAAGFCDWYADADPSSMLRDAAEGAAYSARTDGRITRAGLVHAKVEALRLAIANGEIGPHYQPIVDLRTGEVVGGEALARWQHPTRGLVPPDEFIPLAEHAGLIGTLGERMLRQACRDAACWRADGDVQPEVAVNVSGCQLQDPGFAGVVRDALAAAGLPARRLTLEITESTLAADDPEALATLSELRAHGVRVAMDDFGTGYSSMARLATLPIDVLKIDRVFVRQLDQPGLPLIECMLGLAKRTGLRTVVEGVEDSAQGDAVARFGADYAQGWLFGRPVAAERFPLHQALDVAAR